MSEREIAYSRDADHATCLLCPACGASESVCAMACGRCFRAHWPAVRSSLAATYTILEARDALYDHGVRIRAEGKLPPLAKSGPAPCPGCLSTPCDCAKECWSFVARMHDGGVWWNGMRMVGWSRAEAFDRRARVSADDVESLGPIQRITEPMHDFVESKAVEKTRAGYGWHPIVLGDEIVPRLVATSAQLARLLFSASPLVQAEISKIAEPEATPERRARILEIAWEKTMKEERERAEALAAAVFVAAKGTP
jgi:hypothetical protein